MAGSPFEDAETAPLSPPASPAPVLAPPPPPGAAPKPSWRDAMISAQALIGDRYVLESPAGSGGMGTVFIARDSVLQRKVAIKLLHSSTGLAAARGHHERVLLEARTMAGLNHPNICRIFEVSLDGKVPFIMMDWIDGIHLHDAWRGMNLRARLDLFVKIVNAVAAAHAAGVVHRDLKPTNILIDRRGEPVIVDFGLAKSDGWSERQPTRAGTPGYAAPEQFGDDGEVGPASDVYGLGVLLFQLMTDRLPFRADSMEELKQRVRTEAPPLPESIAPELPWPLQRICLTALERDAKNRYADAQEMAADLSRYQRGETVSARPSILATQFNEQVEQHIGNVRQWHRQGMVTEAESNRMQRLLLQVLRPETHWILDSRKLSVAQVTLYLGAWLVLIALSVGLACGWEALDRASWLRFGLGGVVAASMLIMGVRLQRRGEHRVSLGYLITACLAAPIAVWLIFRETGWLAEITPEGSGRFSTTDLLGDDYDGLRNAQILINALLWFGLTIWLRWRIRSSAFTPFLVIATGFAIGAAWTTPGWLDYWKDDQVAKFGAMWLAVGLAAFHLGLYLNRREEWHQREFGQLRARPRDSWAVLLGALVAIMAGLTLMAWFQPSWYWLGWRQTYEPDSRSIDVTTRAVAFILNGVFLQALVYVLERSKTLVRSRYAELLRWITPQHFLAPLFFLAADALEQWNESIETNPNASAALAWVWVIALFAGAFAFCYLSVLRQWRPFLITGLFYVGVAYYATFGLVSETMSADRLGTSDALYRAQIVLIAAALVIGVAVMVIARRIPATIQSR